MVLGQSGEVFGLIRYVCKKLHGCRLLDVVKGITPVSVILGTVD